jgi:hypothetical protein
LDPPRTGSVAPHSTNPIVAASTTQIDHLIRLPVTFRCFVFILTLLFKFSASFIAKMIPLFNRIVNLETGDTGIRGSRVQG